MNEKMKILIGYDGSECADAALDDLQRSGLPAEAEVTVLTAADVFIPPEISAEDAAAEPFPPNVPHGVKLAWERNKHRFEEAERLAAEAADILQSKFSGWKITPDAHTETPHWAIILKAAEWKPDLIVVGSHGRSVLGRMILGSVSQKVLYESRSSVRIARGRNIPVNTPIRLVAAADGSPDAEAMLDSIVSRNWGKGTLVKLVTVAEPFHPYAVEPDAQMNRIRDIQTLAEQKLIKAGLEVIPIVEQGDPKHILIRESEAWNADCIFLGAQGHRFLDRILLGSVSSAVAARAHCSVEIVRKVSNTNSNESRINVSKQ